MEIILLKSIIFQNLEKFNLNGNGIWSIKILKELIISKKIILTNQFFTAIRLEDYDKNIYIEAFDSDGLFGEGNIYSKIYN